MIRDTFLVIGPWGSILEEQFASFFAESSCE